MYALFIDMDVVGVEDGNAEICRETYVHLLKASALMRPTKAATHLP